LIADIEMLRVMLGIDRWTVLGLSWGTTLGLAYAEAYPQRALVQAFTDEHAHVGQSAPEFAAALDTLMRWIEIGAKPTPQSIAAACEELRASLNGPCRFHPEFNPKSLNTRFYPREITVR
jgi:pimeloyl-ACP methyl ester carboxylesterase